VCIDNIINSWLGRKKREQMRNSYRRCLYVISPGADTAGTVKPTRKCMKWAMLHRREKMWICPRGHGLNTERTKQAEYN
jgi:hypothetical protein